MSSSKIQPPPEVRDGLVATPWDSRTFGIPTYEVISPTLETLREAKKQTGHYTIKVDPLISKRMLHDFGFYYCDTLIQPRCTPDRLIYHENAKAAVSKTGFSFEELRLASHASFLHGRFHRDFNIDPALADIRYDVWLKQLYEAGCAAALVYDGQLAGCFAWEGPKILLHGLRERFRGQGLSKYLWSKACRTMFSEGHAQITSSISAGNTAALNLYASLGFRFGKTVDVYHLLVP